MDHPGPQVRQLSGKDPEGRYLLSVVTRRTYDLGPDGHCTPAEEQVPLVGDPQEHPDIPGLLIHDTDLIPFKPLTDVIVNGHAYGEGRPWFKAGITVEGYEYLMLVIGERRCAVDASGRRIVVSNPEPVDQIPLDATSAYGGHDTIAEEKYGNPYAEMFPTPEALPADLAAMSPFRYPRNPVGRGFLAEGSRAAVEALALPHVEDPWDRWTPERIAAGQPAHWLRMPVPRWPGWQDYGWFPRCGYFGIVPPFEPIEGEPVEAQRGYTPPGLLAMDQPTPERLFRGLCGASPGLQLGPLRGDERILLHHLHPTRAKLPIQLPGDRPNIWTDGRNGQYNRTEPVVHTLLIEPDLDRVTLVWRGSAPALRPYLEEELAEMPLYLSWP